MQPTDQIKTQKPYRSTNQTKKSKNPLIQNQLRINQNQLKPHVKPTQNLKFNNQLKTVPRLEDLERSQEGTAIEDY